MKFLIFRIIAWILIFSSMYGFNTSFSDLKEGGSVNRTMVFSCLFMFSALTLPLISYLEKKSKK
jgi:hypothetical protein